MTGRARDMVLDPEQTDRLREVIAEGEYYGMQTFDQALLRHYQAGRVAMEDALRVASSPHDFKLLVAGDGRTATSMDDIAARASPTRPPRQRRRAGGTEPARGLGAVQRPAGANGRPRAASRPPRLAGHVTSLHPFASIAPAPPSLGGALLQFVKHCANTGYSDGFERHVSGLPHG